MSQELRRQLLDDGYGATIYAWATSGWRRAAIERD